jgi:hypothetical protein
MDENSARRRSVIPVSALFFEEEKKSERGKGGVLGFLGGSRSGLAWEGDKRRGEWLARWRLQQEGVTLSSGLRRGKRAGKLVTVVEGVTRCACLPEKEDKKGRGGLAWVARMRLK